MSNIIAQAVGGAYPVVAYKSLTGTSAQPITSTAGGTALQLNVGGQILNGRPFEVVCQGYVKAHGATQTLKMGLQGQLNASTFSGTQLYTSATASGVMTAGTVYPFYMRVCLFADNTSGILSGFGVQCDGVTPTFVGGAIVSNLLTSVTFGSNNVGTSVTAPLASAQGVALQFCPTITNSVADTTEVFTVTSFYATSD